MALTEEAVSHDEPPGRHFQPAGETTFKIGLIRQLS